MRTSDFDYYLPQELIAQTPVEPREQSRLMVVNRSDGSLKDHKFFEIVDYLQARDVLVFNDSRVIPARLSGKRIDSGDRLEILLLRRITPNSWETLVRCDKRLGIGTQVEIINDSSTSDRQNLKITAEVVEIRQGGQKGGKILSRNNTARAGQNPATTLHSCPLNRPGTLSDSLC